MTTTPLDQAYETMSGAPEDEAARLAFYEVLADCDLFVMLEGEADGDQVRPVLSEVEGLRYALVFDLEERLAEFADGAAHYVALSGRMLAGMLAGQGIGLAVNLKVAPSSILLPPGALEWLGDALGLAPTQSEARLRSVDAPTGFPEALLNPLGRRLATLSGLASAAYLVRLVYDDGAAGYLLAVEGAEAASEPAIAKSVSEAVVFAGIDGLDLGVAFPKAGDTMIERIAAVGIRYDIPAPEQPRAHAPAAPGMDPDKPPKLR